MSSVTPARITYSCVMDASPLFYFQAWNLVHSLVQYAGIPPSDIHIHYTPEVDPTILGEFAPRGFRLVPIARFGDGKYCNKIAQLDSADPGDAGFVVLLDTDMVVLNDLASIADPAAIGGKVVDFTNPELPILIEIFRLAGFRKLPRVCRVDCAEGLTFENNLNGGLYVIPGSWAGRLGRAWKKWATWLLAHPEPLGRAGKSMHVDQVSFALATWELRLPVRHLPRACNYPAHIPLPMSGSPLVLHYHRNLTPQGLIEPAGECDPEFRTAVDRANRLIGASFNNRTFWSFRYSRFAELGSGVGSRGDNLAYKRRLLEWIDIESSASILDVGCGDLEVIQPFKLRKYTGVDVSPEAILRARAKMPGHSFQLFDGRADAVPSAHTVLCFEVLIHQKTEADYRALIDLLTAKTESRLVVSGYAAPKPHHGSNHMLGYHEPLADSLERTGKFSSIRRIGGHTDVEVYLATKR